MMALALPNASRLSHGLRNEGEAGRAIVAAAAAAARTDRAGHTRKRPTSLGIFTVCADSV